MSCKGADMDKAGIREVAKAAGVSISTVSRAFTRPELVSERTRRKVLDVADRFGSLIISRSVDVTEVRANVPCRHADE